MKLILSIIFFIILCLNAGAQKKLSLKEAIETGITNNLDVNQADLLMQKEDVGLKQSKLSMLPDLNVRADHGANQGRSIDPFTNAFIDQNVDYASYGAASNLLLFNGGALQNRIKSNKLGYEASRMELQQAKDNLTINIILAYLNVLSAADILESSQSLSSVTEKQVERLDILNQSGAVAPSLFYDLKGQLANDQIAIVENRNSMEIAKLNLAQLMNVAYDKGLELERISLDTFNTNYPDDPRKIYQSALDQFAQVKAVHFRSESSRKNINSIKGQLFPTLLFSANMNTNYSSVATQSFFANTTIVPTGDYVEVSGSQLPVITKRNNFDTRKIQFGDQLKNNKFTTFNLGLMVPLFNGSRVRSQVKLARIDLKNAELVEQNTKNQLQQSIERAYVNVVSTAEKYKLLMDQVNSFRESFRAAEILFNSGASNSVDYLIAKNNLDRTTTNLIISKYDFVLRTKVLDYYEGKPLW
ncbi:MAG: TolC family protein [Ginsengibacter sp.]